MTAYQMKSFPASLNILIKNQYGMQLILNYSDGDLRKQRTKMFIRYSNIGL